MRTSLLDSFGQRLAQLIAARGINQGEFARQLNASPAFISDMIRGLKKPGAEFLYRLAQQYRVSLDWLVRGVGSMDSENGLDGEWFRAVALRLCLAELTAAGNAEARRLSDELLGNPVTADTSESPALRKTLLDQLAAADKHSTLLLSLYQAFLASPDPQARLRDVLQAALTHYQSTHNDPLAALVAGRDSPSSQNPNAGHTVLTQLVYGIGHRNAGNDFHEH